MISAEREVMSSDGGCERSNGYDVGEMKAKHVDLGTKLKTVGMRSTRGLL